MAKQEPGATKLIESPTILLSPGLLQVGTRKITQDLLGAKIGP